MPRRSCNLNANGINSSWKMHVIAEGFKSDISFKNDSRQNHSVGSFERQDELRSTVGGGILWHERDRTTLELSWLPALWIVSSIVLLGFFIQILLESTCKLTVPRKQAVSSANSSQDRADAGKSLQNQDACHVPTSTDHISHQRTI